MVPGRSPSSLGLRFLPGPLKSVFINTVNFPSSLRCTWNFTLTFVIYYLVPHACTNGLIIGHERMSLSTICTRDRASVRWHVVVCPHPHGAWSRERGAGPLRDGWVSVRLQGRQVPRAPTCCCVDSCVHQGVWWVSPALHLSILAPKLGPFPVPESSAPDLPVAWSHPDALLAWHLPSRWPSVLWTPPWSRPQVWPCPPWDLGPCLSLSPLDPSSPSTPWDPAVGPRCSSHAPTTVC